MRNRFEDRIAKVKVPAKEGFNGGYIRVNGKKVDIYLTNIKQVNTGITISTEVTVIDSIEISPDSLDFGNGVTAYNTIEISPDSLDFDNGVTAYDTIVISPDSLDFDNGRDMTEQEDKNLYNGTVTVGFDGSAAGYNTGENIAVTGYTNGTWVNVQQSEGDTYATYGNHVDFQISRGSKINFVFQYKDANSIWFRAVMGTSGGDTGESNKVSVNGTTTQNMTCTITGTDIVLADYLAEN